MWRDTTKVDSGKIYTCGYCGEKVSPYEGYFNTWRRKTSGSIYICPRCKSPSYFGRYGQVPGAPDGEPVAHLPKEIEQLYQEIRNCTTVKAYTAAIMLCRKLLMNVAVAKGAEPGRKFVNYVDYLASKHYLPPDSQGWVDLIRKKGNEANHEIRLGVKADAKELLDFVGMLLRFIYELPGKAAGS